MGLGSTAAICSILERAFIAARSLWRATVQKSLSAGRQARHQHAAPLRTQYLKSPRAATTAAIIALSRFIRASLRSRTIPDIRPKGFLAGEGVKELIVVAQDIIGLLARTASGGDRGASGCQRRGHRVDPPAVRLS